MLEYLSQFPLDDIDNEYIALNTIGRSRVAPNEIAGVRKIRQLKILITSMMADEIKNGERKQGSTNGTFLVNFQWSSKLQVFGRPLSDTRSPILGRD